MLREPCPHCRPLNMNGCGHCGGLGTISKSRYVPGQHSAGYEPLVKSAEADIARRDARRDARLHDDALAKTTPVETRTVGGTSFGVQDVPPNWTRPTLSAALAAKGRALDELGKMAAAIRERVNFTISEDQAMVKALETPKGGALYAELDRACAAEQWARDGVG